MSPQEELEEKLADEEVIIEEIGKMVLEHISPITKTWTGQKRKFDCQEYTVSIDPYVIKIIKDNYGFEFELRIFINDAADVVMWQTWPKSSAWRVPLSDPDCFKKIRNNLREMIPAIRKRTEGEENGNERTGGDGSGGRPA